jgi:hypothetical protein
MLIVVGYSSASFITRSLDRRRISNVDAVLCKVVNRNRVPVKFNGIDHEREAAARVLEFLALFRLVPAPRAGLSPATAHRRLKEWQAAGSLPRCTRNCCGA